MPGMQAIDETPNDSLYLHPTPTLREEYQRVGDVILHNCMIGTDLTYWYCQGAHAREHHHVASP